MYTHSPSHHATGQNGLLAIGVTILAFSVYLVLQMLNSQPMYQYEDNDGFLRSDNVQQINW